jgi:hypothetical protein
MFFDLVAGCRREFKIHILREQCKNVSAIARTVFHNEEPDGWSF